MRTFKAKWLHRDGYWTSGTFHADSFTEVDKIIGESGGTLAEIWEVK